MISALRLAVVLLVAACTPAAQNPAFPPRVSSAVPQPELPPIKRFAAVAPPGAPVSNSDLAHNFMELSFRLESGREVARFSRFEGPVRVAVRGRGPATLVPDLDDLLGRLRSEAGIDISRTTHSRAQITINTISRAQVRRYLPNAACFVIPGVSTWDEFRQARRAGTIDWTTLSVRQRIAIFIPGDVAPQEVRDCLHEELAQALGPLNDLYWLNESVFNDDNVHAVLTAHDMLILRATYDPALQSGMTKSEVQGLLPSIFARINPGGQSVPSNGPRARGTTWMASVEDALGANLSPRGREAAAQRTLRIARDAQLEATRLGFSHYVLGRMSRDLDRAALSLRNADAVWARTPGHALHRAFAAAQSSALALRAGRMTQAIAMIDRALPVAQNAQNATLLATLMLLKADALERLGRAEEAQALRLDSLGWARYGFGGGREDRVRGGSAQGS